MKNFGEHVQTLSARTPAEGGAHVRVVYVHDIQLDSKKMWLVGSNLISD